MQAVELHSCIMSSKGVWSDLQMTETLLEY